MDIYPVTCPTCFESFDVPLPPREETPSEVDYDCEVCCRPMVIHYREEFGEVVAEASGIHD
ncbi:MAG: CPXCG motif-containing cysteine-rich protein [Verrucomicrobiota bacterium]